MECKNIEGHYNNCKNCQISKKERKKLDIDVKETISWGIDIYTRKNIFFVLPKKLSQQEKLSFIQLALMKAINLQVMKNCCNKNAKLLGGKRL